MCIFHLMRTHVRVVTSTGTPALFQHHVPVLRRHTEARGKPHTNTPKIYGIFITENAVCALEKKNRCVHVPAPTPKQFTCTQLEAPEIMPRMAVVIVMR